MDAAIVELVKQALPLLLRQRQFSWDYDQEADVLYITFERVPATDSDLTDEDFVFRYSGDQLIGVTVLHASTHAAALSAK